MGAYSRRKTSLRRNIRKKNNMTNRKSLKKTFRKKRKSIKKGGFRKSKTKSKSKRSRQRGGYQTTQVGCANSNVNVNSNKNLFEMSFSIDRNNANNTAPPTCNFVGINSSGTSAYSCV